MEDSNNYDYIILGTGVKECILAGLLTKFEDKKVIQIDRNPYYGGEAASVNLSNLYKHFRNDTTHPTTLGENRDWNVDLVSKLILANGNLVKILIKSNVSQYLEFKALECKFVLQGSNLIKVPTNDKEALQTELLSVTEKASCTLFFHFVQGYKENDSSTHQGKDIQAPFKEFIKGFNFSEHTVDFIGYAVCNELNNAYLDYPAATVLKKIQSYLDSVGRYGNTPYIYPLYGLSGLPEGFSRLTAINRGITMLARNVDEVILADGKFAGIKSGDEVINGKVLIADPSYLTPLNKLVNRGKVLRAICIIDHPVPNTNNTAGGQIFIPKKELGRQNDIVMIYLNHGFYICKKGFYIVFITTVSETSDAKKELEPAIALLGSVTETFITVSDLYGPQDNSGADGIHVCSSLSPETTLETDTAEVLRIYKSITGKDLDLEA